MKKIFALAAACFLTTGLVLAQNDFCKLKNTSFRSGERMLFRVFYNMSPLWVPAGDATFTVQSETVSGNKVYHITGLGKTLKSYEWFYKVNDRYETWLDEETLLPQRFLREVNEGGLKFKHDVRFDHDAGKAVSGTGTYKIPKCTQDVLSAIYYARNIDYSKYKPGAKIPFQMFLDDKVYDLYIRYIGKEIVETKAGKFAAIKIAPLLIEGTIFSGGEKMTVWVSDDANHVPVRISSPIAVGTIKVDLMECSNLRYPLTAMIKK